MRSFWGLVPRYIRKNGSRVFFMASGIVLTIALIISIFIMKEALIEAYKLKQIENMGGKYDISLMTRDYKAIENLEKDDLISKISVITPFGTSKIDNTKYTIDISGYEENIDEFLNYKVSKGRIPENDNEIALESWILDILPEKYQIGDKINLKSYLEYIGTTKRETIEKENEFILVGTFEYIFIGNTEKEVGKAYVTRRFAEDSLIRKEATLKAYLNVNTNYSIDKTYKMLVSTPGYTETFFNPNYAKDYSAKLIKMLDGVCYILFIIIGIVAGIIIYNIFNVSVSERIKEFGMLRAIGASSGRIITMVILEGVIIGIVFVPIGIFVGSFFTRFVITNTSGINSFLEIPRLSKEILLLSYIIGFSFIILGSYGPARKAGKISPMEAIASNNNLSLSSKMVKSNIELDRQFKFTTNMAIINIKRNKKRFITSVTSLIITITMFIISYYLLNFLDPVNTFKNGYNGDFTITSSSVIGVSDKELTEVSKINGIKIGTKTREFSAPMQVSKEVMTREGIEYFEEESYYNNYIMELYKQNKFEFATSAYAFSEEKLISLKDKVISGSIDIIEMNNNPTVAMVQNMNGYEYTNMKVGDEIEIVKLRYNEKGDFIGQDIQRFTIGAILSEDAIENTDNQGRNAIIFSYAGAEKHYNITGYRKVSLYLDKNSDYEKYEKQISDALKKVRDVKVTSFKEELEKVKNINKRISIIIYSFVFIIIIVSIMNLINVMRMNVISRNKEIGMMRALGFGEDEVRDMIKIEGILYGITASVIGVILGNILSWLIYINGRMTLLKGAVWKIHLIILALIFLVTIITTTMASIIPCRQLFKTNIIDSIRSVE
ncbi:FtsX-like permease family protein [Clostridium sp.]|uniref:ABC transporter permease n=1 Tax=Clostridium sp. TaxID=1506 RepID=UPI00321650AF